jgi:D-3-phosphoglycerate dehydrogenase / 2-oxoglutarate reductase
MYKIQTYNKIALVGLEQFERSTYEVASGLSGSDAILLRSHNLQVSEVAPTVKAIARAGAGVNNIPVAALTDRGVVVFNAPGANANAVKELVLASMLLGSRDIIGGVQFVNGLKIQDKKELSNLLEEEKKRFAGSEIAGKTLGVVGLGAIGSMVANMAIELGMNVLGYDPAISVEAAWRLSHEVRRMESMSSLFAKSDYISLHLPMLESTKNMINNEVLANVKPGACLLNFAREGIVDTTAVIASLNLEQKGLRAYIADFPMPELIGRKDVILMPHIGASTQEAEDNCAVMAAQQLKDFLVNGNIRNSVNFPTISMDRSSAYRLAFSNRNVPKMLGQVLSVLADANINVVDMINKSRDEIAYNLIDTESPLSSEVTAKIAAIDGVIAVRIV